MIITGTAVEILTLFRGLDYAIIAEIKKLGENMSAELTALTAKVTANNSLIESAVDLIGGLAQQISDLKNDPAALQALADSLTSEDTKLAAAITANTAPPPVPAA